jgi:hypothetical protein
MPASQRGVPNGRIKSLEFIKTCLRNYDELGANAGNRLLAKTVWQVMELQPGD